VNETTDRKTVPFWLLGVPVAAWALHFLSSYVAAAVYCAKSTALDTAASTPISTARWLIVAITILTVAVTSLAAVRGYAALPAAGVSEPTGGSGEDNRFLGSVLLLLCALSAVAMLFVAAVAFSFGDCRQ
jgi:uncharacterized membrane protein YgcG